MLLLSIIDVSGILEILTHDGAKKTSVQENAKRLTISKLSFKFSYNCKQCNDVISL